MGRIITYQKRLDKDGSPVRDDNGIEIMDIISDCEFEDPPSEMSYEDRITTLEAEKQELQDQLTKIMQFLKL